MNNLPNEIAKATQSDSRDMDRSRPYDGQPHTILGTRGSTEIKGITFRDLRDAYIRAIMLSTGGGDIDGFDADWAYDEASKGEHALLSANDLYALDFNEIDPIAVIQNLSCEIERLMGIFPNVQSLKHRQPDI